MAYVNVYSAGWHSKDIAGYLYILKDGGSGAVVPLTLKNESIRVSYGFEGFDSPIIGMTCEFEIIDTETDWFTLNPLLVATEREYKVQIVTTTETPNITLFEGYLNCDNNSRKYLHRQAINLVASSYLSKLENLNPLSIETLQNLVFINLIDEMLTSIGASFNIRVNSSLFSVDDSGHTASGDTVFNRNGLYAEFGWTDNVERKTSMEILSSILTAFNCYIYWWNGYWYIERFEDAWSTNTNYVEYTTGTAYSPIIRGTVVNVTSSIADLHTLIFLNQSQTVQIKAGYKNITLSLDQTVMNLSRTDFENALPLDWSATDGTDHLNLKQIYYYENSGHRFPGDEGFQYTIQCPYSAIKQGILRTGWPFDLGYPIYYDLPSVNQKFKVNIQDSSVIQTLNISWNFIPLPELDFDPRTHNYQCRWFLKLKDTQTDSYVADKFIVYKATSPGASTYSWQIIEDLDPIDYAQKIDFEGSQLGVSDPVLGMGLGIGSVNASVTINASSLDLPLGENEFVFGIMSETASNIATPKVFDHYVSRCVIGDILISQSGVKDTDNVIEGTVNTKFLNKKTIQVDLYDCDSCLFTNSILQVQRDFSDGILAQSTDGWLDATHTGPFANLLPLVDLLLESKFRMGNVSRQKLTATVRRNMFLKPFQKYTDSKQADKKFLLMGNSYNLCSDTYDIELEEYDNTTAITLI